MHVTEDNFELISKAELNSEVFLNISLSTQGFTLSDDGGFDISKLENGKWDSKTIRYRMKNTVFNITNKYGSCQQLPLKEYQEKKNFTYFRYFAPKEPVADLVYRNVYQYDFQFKSAEVYAMIWQKKKIEFINQLARQWGGAIKARADA